MSADQPITTDRVDNPFGTGVVTARRATGAGSSDESKAVAEVQAALVVAKAHPRNERAAMDRIINSCSRMGLAEAAVYSYARGKETVEGPSIRLAEAMAQGWGNMSFGIREIEAANGVSDVVAYCWDLETNTRREVSFKVKHWRHTRNGGYPLEDPRDIYEQVANQGARRLRACILAVIPGDVQDAAVAQCNATLASRVDMSPEALAKILNAFAALGVSKARLEAFLQRRWESIERGHVLRLGKIYTSIRDGVGKVEEWFPPDESARDGDDLMGLDGLNKALSKKDAAKGKSSAGQEAVAPDDAGDDALFGPAAEQVEDEA